MSKEIFSDRKFYRLQQIDYCIKINLLIKFNETNINMLVKFNIPNLTDKETDYIFSQTISVEKDIQKYCTKGDKFNRVFNFLLNGTYMQLCFT